MYGKTIEGVGGEKMTDRVDTCLASLGPEMWVMADRIFDHPETGLKEYMASALLEDWLEAHGFHVERGLGSLETAFRATYEQGYRGPSIGLLCEYDALEGMGHACGHHLQGPCILAAAQAVKECMEGKDYRIVVYGTPAEETVSGKIQMIKEGCFQDIEVALMMHGAPTTTTDIKSLANCSVSAVFTGRAAHAAIKPEQGRSALDALILAFQGVEFLREHVKDDVRMHYTVKNCGASPVNVVPSLAEGMFSLRSYNVKTLDSVCERFVKVLEGAAMMTETQVDIRVNKKVSNKILSCRLNELLMKYAEEAGAPGISPPREKTGSTDLGDVMQLMPGSCIRVAFVPEEASPHSEAYLAAGKSEEAHRAILLGAKILAHTVSELIEDRALLEAVKQDFQEAKEKQSKEA